MGNTSGQQQQQHERTPIKTDHHRGRAIIKTHTPRTKNRASLYGVPFLTLCVPPGSAKGSVVFLL